MRHLVWLAMLLGFPAAAQDAVDFGDGRVTLMNDPVRIRYAPGAKPPAPERLRRAIDIAAAGREWLVVSETPNGAELMREVRGRHQVKLGVSCAAAGCDIRYLDSADLLYREKEIAGAKLRGIHKNYNGWVADLAKTLAFSLGVPTRTFVGFALLDDEQAVPFLSEQGRAAYKEFLAGNKPRAFAIGPNGAFGWSAPLPTATAFGLRNFDPVYNAMQHCLRSSTGACQLYAVDDRVVWTE